MIRWVVEGRLGTAAYDTLGDIDATILDARYLVDKKGNAPEKVALLIAQGVRALEAGEVVVVACDFGVSRSNSIAAGILAIWQKLDLDQSLQTLFERTGEKSIKLEMIETVRQALGEATMRETDEAILVTGGSGFLGRNLIPALLEEGRFNVCAPSREELNLLGSSASISAFVRKHNVGQIVHLAYPRIYTNISSMGETIIMLRNLIEVCLVHNVRLICLSGAPVFSGYETSFLKADLDLMPRPRHVYGETKFLEEGLISAAIKSSKLDASIVRLAPTYGPGGDRPRFIQQFRNAIKAGKTLETHLFCNGVPKLELLYINDAVSALTQILCKRLTGNFHVGGGLVYSPLDVAVVISKLIGRKFSHVEIKIDDYVSNIVLGRHSDRSDFDWQPLVGLEEGLRCTLELH